MPPINKKVKLPLLDIKNMSFFLIAPRKPTKTRPINLIKDMDKYSVEIYIEEKRVMNLSIDEFLEFCRGMALTRFTFELAQGKLCKHCAHLLYTTIYDNVHEVLCEAMDLAVDSSH